MRIASQYVVLNPCMLPSDDDHRRSFSGPERNLVLPPRHTCLRTKAAVKALGSHGGRGPLQALKVQLQERSSAADTANGLPPRPLELLVPSGAPMPSSTWLSPGEPCTVAWWLFIQRLVCTQH